MAVITFNNTQEKIRTIEGTQRTTPIDIETLDNRITKLEQEQLKDKYHILTFKSHTTLTLPKGFENCKMYPCQINAWTPGICTSNLSNTHFAVDLLSEGTGTKKTVEFVKSGLNVTAKAVSDRKYSFSKPITLVCVI